MEIRLNLNLLFSFHCTACWRADSCSTPASLGNGNISKHVSSFMVVFRKGLVRSIASSTGLQRKRSFDSNIAFSFFFSLFFSHELATPNKVQPRSNGLTFPMLKVSSPSCFSIFFASSSSSAISMLSFDQMISVSALTFPICGGKRH